jgi:uncharacterized protein (TIGR03435 family)
MPGHLMDASLRSLLVAAVAGAAVLMMGRRRTAALEHSVWMAVACGMLALFVCGSSLPRLPLRVRAAATMQRGASGTVIVDLEGSEARARGLVAGGTPARAIDWSTAAGWMYGIVALALLARFATGVCLVRRLMVSARQVEIGAWESERIAVPVTIGCWHPRVLLPVGWREWSREKLEAVLTHEGAHARRRDGLSAAIAAVNRCVFWFHPLAWVLERRLALLAEQACDEYSVAALGDRDWYARLLIEMAGAVDPAQGRLRGHALTMAAASHIRRRIEWLLRPGRIFSRGMTRAGWMTVAACAVLLVFGAGAVELEQQTAQTPAAAAPGPTFEVASIKPCASGDTGGKKGGRGGGGGPATTPGRMNVTCMTARDLIRRAYVEFSDEAPVNSTFRDEQVIRGGPAWVTSERYTITAETDDPVAQGPTNGRMLPATKRMNGPMLRALLEERFRLKIHQDQEEIQMYALTIAKGGFKLKPMEPGGCRALDESRGVSMEEMNAPGQKPLCVNHVGLHGPNFTMDAAGSTMHRFALALGGMLMGRPVLDKTGISGEYSFHLEFLRDDATLNGLRPRPDDPDTAADVPAAPSIFAEVERTMGLKLVADKGPRGYLVIDHVERPSEN